MFLVSKGEEREAEDYLCIGECKVIKSYKTNYITCKFGMRSYLFAVG